MKNLLNILGLLLLVLTIQSQPAHLASMIEQANQAYSSADYETVVSQYESVLDSGYESADLYFNLGNAYFKLGNIPAAILHYEKARKMDPADENIRFNLNLANSRIIDKMEPLPEFFLKTWFKSARDILSSDQWARIVITGFILALVSLLLFLISRSVAIRKWTFWAALFCVAVMTVSLIFSVSGYREYKRQSSAIIFTPTVTVKSSPNDSSVDLFVIHEGTKVNITDLVEEWSEVRLANGNVGWIRTETFRRI
jgi:tetratricopeptide (TPR) repeat protein